MWCRCREDERGAVSGAACAVRRAASARQGGAGRGRRAAARPELVGAGRAGGGVELRGFVEDLAALLADELAAVVDVGVLPEAVGGELPAGLRGEGRGGRGVTRGRRGEEVGRSGGGARAPSARRLGWRGRGSGRSG